MGKLKVLLHDDKQKSPETFGVTKKTVKKSFLRGRREGGRKRSHIIENEPWTFAKIRANDYFNNQVLRADSKQAVLKRVARLIRQTARFEYHSWHEGVGCVGCRSLPHSEYRMM